MSPFWGSLFEHLKHCGRSASLFLITLAVLFILLCLAAFILSTELYKVIVPALAVIVVLGVALLVVVIRRARARRRERAETSPLSRDELRVARSKLVKDRNRVNSLWVLL